jgi:Tfp pilus assembly protein PilN
MTVLHAHAIPLDGFNLLPYRSRRRREARDRRCALLVGAALAGCAAAAVVAGWDVHQRERLDGRRAVLQASLERMAAPLAEHARLVEQDGQRRIAREQAEPLAVPRIRLLALLDALAASALRGGVALQRVSQHAHEVELEGLAPDSQTAARWLKRLESVREVRSVEVVEMRRRAVSPRRTAAPEAGTYEFTALVRWAAAKGAARTTQRSSQ